MIKTVSQAIEEKEWSKIPIEVYFYWNEDKLDNSGQVHIRSKKKIGFISGDIVDIYIDIENDYILILNDSQLKPPGRNKANKEDVWRILTQGKKKIQDFDFKHRPLFDLLDINKTITLPAIKVRASNYMMCDPNRFAILVDLGKLYT